MAFLPNEIWVEIIKKTRYIDVDIICFEKISFSMS